MEKQCDVTIIGGGHNGLVAASYLGKQGLSVTVLEKNDKVGGAAISKQTFEGVDVRLSEYAYLLCLFPWKIMKALELDLESRRRETASFTPSHGEKALLVSNISDEVNRESFRLFTGEEREYQNFQRFYALTKELAKAMWPGMLSPLVSKKTIEKSLTTEEQKEAWRWFVERPIGEAMETFFQDDFVRGLVFTDAKIGSFTHAYDETGLQNRTFAYHVIGNETGEWQVPVGGMGQVTNALRACALHHGVDILTGCDITGIETDGREAVTTFGCAGEEHKLPSRYLLSNVAPQVLYRLIKDAPPYIQNSSNGSPEGSAFKMNMVLQKLPALKTDHYKSEQAFRGTFHVDEHYSNLEQTFKDASRGVVPQYPGGEMYCHSLTDPSIVSPELQAQGYQTLTFFGIDMPYRLFVSDPEGVKALVKSKCIDAINRYTAEDIRDCLARDCNGQPCIDVKSPIDLERILGMPQGNIFQVPLQWPYAEREDEEGTWGVETPIKNVFLCGASARRGGGVSGIPGHNAAMKVLECEGNT